MPSRSPFPDVPVEYGPFYEKLLEQIWKHHVENPDRKAFISAENPSDYCTWKQLYVCAHSIGKFLNSQGFGRGHVACVVIPNSWQYAAIFLGTSVAQGAMSGASAMFTDYELGCQFKESKCSAIFTDEFHLDRVMRATKELDHIKTIICIRSSDNLLPENVVDFAEVLRTLPNFAPRHNSGFHPDDLLILPFSSGTTGSPKGVQLTHKNFGTMMSVFMNYFKLELMPQVLPDFVHRKEFIILLLPFYHIYGFGMMIKNLLDGTTGVIFAKFEPPVLLKAIEQYKVKSLFLVPPIIIFLAKHQIVDKFDISSVRAVFSGAAPCGRDIVEELKRRHKNVKFFGQGYGMTECGMVSHLPCPSRPSPPSSIGVLVANFEQKIVDTKTGKECAVGESGEIWLRGPSVMYGYLNRPKETAETIDAEGWLHTGDVGNLDGYGNLTIVDRIKELIKVKGLQVPPSELEDLLLSHPKIKDAAVIGIPDPRTGEAPKAFVVRAADDLTEDAVADFVKSKVSSYKHLTGGVEFVEEIPKSPSGKILRRFLKDREASKTKSKL